MSADSPMAAEKLTSRELRVGPKRAAVHESGVGTKLPTQNLRFRVRSRRPSGRGTNIPKAMVMT